MPLMTQHDVVDAIPADEPRCVPEKQPEEPLGLGDNVPLATTPSTKAITTSVTEEEDAAPAAQDSDDHGHCTSEQELMMEIDDDDNCDDTAIISRPGALDNDDHHDDDPHETLEVKQETTEEVGMEAASILKPLPSQSHQQEETSRTENEESGENIKELLLRPTTRLLRAQFRCQKCSRTFSSKVKLDSHVETHDDDDPNLADEDDDALSSGSEVESDDDGEVESEESYSEPESDNIVVTKNVEEEEEEQIESHLKMSIISNTITAPPLSSEDLPEPQDTLEPSSSEPTETQFPCSICKTTFCRPDRLQKHYRTHHGTTSSGGSPLSEEVVVHRCTETSCSAYFILPIQLKYHQIRFHSKKKKRSAVYTTCPICKARLASKKEARRHYEMYHEKRKAGPRATFRCGLDQCAAYFVRRQQLAKHQELFHQAASSETARPKLGERCCTICQIDFSSDYSVRQHFRSHHDTRPYQVRRCGETGCSVYFLTPEELDRHQESVHGKSRTVVQNTEGTVADQSRVSQGGSSLRLPGKEGGLVVKPRTLPKFSASHWCSICKTEYSSAHHLKEHHALCHDLSDVDPASVKRCSQPGCSAHFRTSHQLSVHLLRVHGASLHNKKRKYACSGCEKRFTELWALQGHFAAFHELSGALQGPDAAELHKCDQPSCTAYFLQRGQLERHRGVVHDKWQECKDCGKEFRLRKWLNKHRRQAHKLKVDLRFRCDEVDPPCGKSFETEVDLQNHAKYWHRNKNPERVKPVACPKCDKVCNGQAALRAHLLNHDRGIMSYVCEQCGKSFKDIVRLNLHYKAHAGRDSWEFQCSTCGKKCLTKGKLEEHSRTHTGEKPYCCQHCGLSYAHRHNLRIHVNSKHPEGPPDLPKPFNKTNLTSRKGVKIKKMKVGDSGRTK